MNGFIHTFSLETKISYDSFIKLKEAYKNMFWNSNKQEHIIPDYADYGLRIGIKNRCNKEIRYDKEHHKKKVTMIFTLYKLLYPGESMGQLTEKQDIIRACEKIVDLLRDVADKSGVELWRCVKVKRVDVTHDVITPSEEYSRELIKIAKKALLPYGYTFWEPSEVEKNTKDWDVDNAVFFNNHNQEIEAKIYNKKADKDVADQLSKDIKDRGLVRFELALKRRFLREERYIQDNVIDIRDLEQILSLITEDSGDLLSEYMGRVLSNGEMLSKKVLIAYIQKKYKGKEKRIDNMMFYIELKNQKGDVNKYGSSKSIRNIEKHFEKINVSPIYTRKECPYIPSFDKLLNDLSPNQKFLRMAQAYNENRGYRYKYWI